MDILSSLHTQSISELRKILKDNNVKEISKSKEELLQQVTEVVLTSLMIQEMMEKEDTTHISIPKNVCTQLREEQDREYEECLKNDILATTDNTTHTEETSRIIFEELSPKSLREKRLTYFM